MTSIEKQSLLAAYEEAARLVVQSSFKCGLKCSIAYELARDIWGLYWKVYEEETTDATGTNLS